MAAGDPSSRRVAVYFGSESYVVDVEVDPTDPPTEDSLIDMARERVVREHAPAGTFRKGEIVR